jgi:hypothetical protein
MMKDQVRTIDVGWFPEHDRFPEEANALLNTSDEGEILAVASDDQVGLLRLFSLSPQDVPESLPTGNNWTRYEVRAGTQGGSLDGSSALVLSEEDSFQEGVSDQAYERWVEDQWGPGVTSLPGYSAALLIRGTAGARTGKYSSIGWFTTVDARDQLLVALTPDYPSELAGYRKLIDEAFGKYLDRSRRRFLRLHVIPSQ